MKHWLRQILTVTTALFMVLSAQPVKADGPDKTIEYDGSSYVVTEGETTIYLYCLQNGLKWPDSAEPYQEISFQDFCLANGLTQQADIDNLADQLKRVIYAGYNSNGFGAFSEKNPTPITDDDFNKLLSLSDDDPLRTDFPDTIGTKI